MPVLIEFCLLTGSVGGWVLVLNVTRGSVGNFITSAHSYVNSPSYGFLVGILCQLRSFGNKVLNPFPSPQSILYFCYSDEVDNTEITCYMAPRWAGRNFLILYNSVFFDWYLPFVFFWWAQLVSISYTMFFWLIIDLRGKKLFKNNPKTKNRNLPNFDFLLWPGEIFWEVDVGIFPTLCLRSA